MNQTNTSEKGEEKEPNYCPTAGDITGYYGMCEVPGCTGDSHYYIPPVNQSVEQAAEYLFPVHDEMDENEKYVQFSRRNGFHLGHSYASKGEDHQEHHDQLHIQYLEDKNKELTKAFMELLEVHVSDLDSTHRMKEISRNEWLEQAGLPPTQP